MKLTAIIINFLREPYLWTCIDSLKENYPDIKIKVGENGNYTEEKKQRLNELGADYIDLPFDSGVCYGRNRLVEKVRTKYVMVGDDDFKYTPKAKVEEMVAFLEAHPEYDLIGGRIIEGDEVRNYQGFFHFEEKGLRMENFDLDGEYKRCKKTGLKYESADLTFNFFVARTKSIKQVKWDEKIKVAYEHSDYFIQFKEAGFKVAFSPEPIVIHKPPIKEKIDLGKYKTFRCRQSDKDRFYEKYDLNYIIDIHGRRATNARVWLNDIDFIIKTFKRRESLEKLLFSIAKYYPEANVYIADDDKIFDVPYYKDLWQRLADEGMANKPTAFNMDFDSGLSKSRNFLVENTPRKYKLLLDDDFIFTEETNIKKFWEHLEWNNYVGIIGGAIRQDNNIRHYEGHFKFNKLTRTLRQIKLNYEEVTSPTECEIVFNFFLGRKKLLEAIKWDDEIKIGGEHTDFFYRLKQATKYKVVYDPNVIVGHEQHFTPEYKEFRKRMEFMQILFEKHNIKRIINFNGVVYEQAKDGAIKKYRDN